MAVIESGMWGKRAESPSPVEQEIISEFERVYAPLYAQLVILDTGILPKSHTPKYQVGSIVLRPDNQGDVDLLKESLPPTYGERTIFIDDVISDELL